MPTWGELLQELKILQESAAERPEEFGGQSPFDVLRRKYLRALSKKTGRATIIYATAWMENKEGLSAEALTINLGDIHGFMEAVSNVEERQVDLFLHSPGGSAEAAESIVEYLRTRFDHIRVVVPVAAMSAATMVALGADEIVMGAHSQLGPIDPQFTIFTPEGPRSAPAQAIKDQFEMAKAECQDPTNIAAWLPIVRSYAPGLLAQCDHQRALAEELVHRWLGKYMFKDVDDPEEKARAAAAWFADFTAFRSHGRRVSRDDARAQGLNVTGLEEDGELQDAMLSVHHAIRHTLAGTGATKIVENHHGRAYVEMVNQVALIPAPAQPQQPPLRAVPPQAPAAMPNRNRQRKKRRR